MYFDYAATTPPDEEVLETFEKVNRNFWANPHALHRLGMRAESLLEQARMQVLSLMGAGNGYRCIFTSGATESNNMAIRGVAQLCKARGRHLITSAVEHPSVLQVLYALQRQGWELTVLSVNDRGSVYPEALREALRPDTALVSLMHVNNEIGSINDLHGLGQVIRENSRALFHVDAAQSVGKFAFKMDDSEVDLLTFSAHKFFGLKGTGALLLDKRIDLPALLLGGGQESGFRSGTADAARAAAMAKALRISLSKADEAYCRVKGFKQQILEAFGNIDGTQLNGSPEDASAYIVNVSVNGVRPETILQALAEQDIYISTVSACSAKERAESYVVYELTGSHARAQSSIRISMSSQTTQDEVDALCAAVGPVIESLRVVK